MRIAPSAKARKARLLFCRTDSGAPWSPPTEPELGGSSVDDGGVEDPSRTGTSPPGAGGGAVDPAAASSVTSGIERRGGNAAGSIGWRRTSVASSGAGGGAVVIVFGFDEGAEESGGTGTALAIAGNVCFADARLRARRSSDSSGRSPSARSLAINSAGIAPTFVVAL